MNRHFNLSNQGIALSLAVLLFCSCGEQTASSGIQVKQTTGSASQFQSQTEQVQKTTPQKKTELTDRAEEEQAESVWSMFRGDPLGTGYTEHALPGELSILWEFKVERGAFESTAAIVDGVAYAGDLDGSLFALDLNTGEKKWEFKVENMMGYVASPSVRDGRIYIGNIDGMFFCVDMDGKELWRHESLAEIDSSANFYKDNVIYGSQDATLYCLNQKSGKLVWKHEIDDQIRCSPTIVENRAFVAGCDGRLHIIDLDSGSAVAAVEIDSPTGVTPAVMGDAAYFGTEQAGFFSVDWKKHQVNWRFDDPDGVTSTRSNPAVTKGHVIFGARNRHVRSLNPDNGEINWSFEARGPVDSSPVIADQRVYVGADDGRLYTLDLATGKLISEIELNGKIIGSPAVASGRLIVATSRGVVYCLGKK